MQRTQRKIVSRKLHLRSWRKKTHASQYGTSASYATNAFEASNAVVHYSML